MDGDKKDGSGAQQTDHSEHHADQQAGAGGASGSRPHQHKGSSLCGGEWKYPVTCDPVQMDCTYYAKWEYLESSDQIRFTLTANQTNRWVAIGFGETTSMVSSAIFLH